MSKSHKELYRHQKKSVKQTNREARMQKKHLKEQKKKQSAERREKSKAYPMLYKRMKEEWKGVAATEPNRRNVAAKRREIYKNFKLVNWVDIIKLKSYNRAAERRRHHYMMKTYDPQYKTVKKERKVSMKSEGRMVMI